LSRLITSPFEFHVPPVIGEARSAGDQANVHVHVAGVVKEPLIALGGVAGNGYLASIGYCFRVRLEQFDTARSHQQQAGRTVQVHPAGLTQGHRRKS
jgi:hypothetical protein